MKFTATGLALVALVCAMFWITATVLLLPITNVSDGHGHGPDYDSKEWRNAVEARTAKRTRMIRSGTLSLAVVGAAFVSVLAVHHALVRRPRLNAPDRKPVMK